MKMALSAFAFRRSHTPLDLTEEVLILSSQRKSLRAIELSYGCCFDVHLSSRHEELADVLNGNFGVVDLYFATDLGTQTKAIIDCNLVANKYGRAMLWEEEASLCTLVACLCKVAKEQDPPSEKFSFILPEGSYWEEDNDEQKQLLSQAFQLNTKFCLLLARPSLWAIAAAAHG